LRCRARESVPAVQGVRFAPQCHDQSRLPVFASHTHTHCICLGIHGPLQTVTVTVMVPPPRSPDSGDRSDSEAVGARDRPADSDCCRQLRGLELPSLRGFLKTAGIGSLAPSIFQDRLDAEPLHTEPRQAPPGPPPPHVTGNGRRALRSAAQG
jgi:hypothetical protein